MKRYLPAVLCISIAILAGAAMLADSSSADDGYTVKGTVINYDGSALSGVDVSISCNGSTYADRTDSTGKFTIYGLPGYSDLAISFDHYAMTVTAYDTSVMTATGTGGYRLVLGTPSAEGVYDLTGSPVTMMETRFSGYVMDMGSSGNIPLAGSIVMLYDGMNHRYTAVIDDTGKFTINIGTIYNLKMSIVEEGYTPVPGVSFMTLDASGNIHFSLRGSVTELGMEYRLPYTDANGIRTYYLGDSYPILVSSSTGDAVVYVMNSKGLPLQGCTVTLSSTTDSKVKYISTTTQNGSAKFQSISTGTYTINVGVGGFESYTEEDIEINKGSNVLDPVTLTEMKNTDYFGMNIEHLLMIAGVVIGLLLVGFSYMLFSRRIRLDIDSED